MPRRDPSGKPAKRAVRRAPTLNPDDLGELFDVGRSAGLDLVGACRAAAWSSTRSQLERRKAAGLHSTMAFTFKNPARSSEPTRVMKHASTLIVGARGYVQDPGNGTHPGDAPDIRTSGIQTSGIETPGNGTGDRGPTPVVGGDVAAQVARYATADHYGLLKSSLDEVAAALRGRGARAVVVLDRNDIVDREAAWRSGIGWYGKNSLLLSPGWGSWLVLGSVVTDAAIVDHTPSPIADHCGPCRRCIDACPTDAIVADGVVDAGRCLSWLLQAAGPFPLEFREALGDRLYGCDDCQTVCPPNRAVELRSTRLGTARRDADPGRWVGALELLGLDDAALLERCARWYIAGRDPRIVRRNLLIILGNAAHPDDERVLAELHRFCATGDALLVEHAAWALDRLRARSRRVVDAAGGGSDGTGTSTEAPRQ